jgi:acetyl-CoA carboxylase biotin carboxyl carrier protein
MPKYRLVAKVDSEPDKSFVVRSPAVGLADGVPQKGVYLNPSEGFLHLTVLNRRHVLQLPRNVQGTVTEQLIEDTSTPVAYGQPLLRLSPVRELGLAAEGAAGRAATSEAAEDLIAVKAPSDGVFYRRPTPDSAPYVQEDADIGSGAVLGLVEVMKCFNQITYGGPDLPERVKVVRILIGDTAEVAYGQTLFLVRPL